MGSSGGASGGGSGSTITRASGLITTGDFVSTNVGSTWTQVPNLTFSINAAVGHRINASCSFLFRASGTTFLDLAVKVGSSFVRYASSDTATPAAEGDGGVYPNPDSLYVGANGTEMDFTVVSGDLSTGTLTFALVYMGTGTTSTIYSSTSFPFRWRITNYGS